MYLIRIGILVACVDEVAKEDTDVTRDSGDADTDSDTDSDTDADTDTDTDTDTTPPVDADADGYGVDEDCDDSDAAVNPGAEEICGNGVDDDCDGGASGCTGYEVSVEDADAVIVGTQEYDNLSFQSVLDLDEDGYDEVVYYWYEPTAGRGGLYFAESPFTGTIEAGVAAASILAGDSEVVAGIPVSADFDGDGVLDLAVGNESGGDYYEGMIYVIPGPITLGDTFDRYSTSLRGGGDYGYVGSVLAEGDVDGDGDAEIIASEYPLDLVYVVPMPLTGDVAIRAVGIEIDLAVDSFSDGAAGWDLDVVDYDGDGIEDLLVGAPGVETGDGTDNIGAVYVVLGPISSDLELGDVSARVFGPTGEGAIGYTSVAGDVDGDGSVDLLLADYRDATNGDFSGKVWLLTSTAVGDVNVESAASAKLLGAAEYVSLGRDAHLGDMDGDGCEDLLLGTIRPDEVFVFWGAPTGDHTTDDADIRIYSDEEVDSFGTRVAAGSFDGDEFADLVISAPNSDVNASGGGADYLFLGASFL